MSPTAISTISDLSASIHNQYSATPLRRRDRHSIREICSIENTSNASASENAWSCAHESGRHSFTHSLSIIPPGIKATPARRKGQPVKAVLRYTHTMQTFTTCLKQSVRQHASGSGRQNIRLRREDERRVHNPPRHFPYTQQTSQEKACETQQGLTTIGGEKTLQFL